MYLRNSQLDQIDHATNILIELKDYIENKETTDFYKSTGITLAELAVVIKNLQRIHFSKNLQNAINNKKANAYNKAHKDYHRITSNMADAKKRNSTERYNYWKEKLEEYKRNKKK